MMKFPEKLWSLVNECTSGAIFWGTDGKTIVIDCPKFEKEFLGENNAIFKTKNIVSFIRQLNLYGFRKCNRRMNIHEFKNLNFVRGREDLLKFMTRGCGCVSDIKSPVTKVKKEDSGKKDTNDKVSDPDKESLKNISPPGSYNVASYPFSSLQGFNPLSNSLWGTTYNPLNLAYPGMHPLRNESYASLIGKEEQTDISDRAEDNLSWGNLGMYGNVFFVPVPAQYGMYPGYFNGNLPNPFPMPQHNETKDRSDEQ